LLHSSSKALLTAAQYSNAATVEFLVDEEENVYFLEVNSRLQVEHPVTEAITGIDLVALQIAIARGESLNSLLPEGTLPTKPSDHAIELRVCAEKPYEGFRASTGLLQKLVFPTPQEESLRIDTGFVEGSRVSHYYDSLLAKIIVSGSTREEAIAKAQQALQDTFIAGVDTNTGYLSALLHDEDFRFCRHHTKTADGLTERPPFEVAELVCGAFLSLLSLREDGLSPFRLLPEPSYQTYSFLVADTLYTLRVESMKEYECKVSVSCSHGEDTCEWPFLLDLHEQNSPHSLISINGIRHKLQSFWTKDHKGWIQVGGTAVSLLRTWPTLKESTTSNAHGVNQLLSPLPGKILSLNAAVGQEVQQGDKLVTLESMKMEHPLEAPRSGTIASIGVQEGDVIESGTLLVSFC
ncbi:MAG: hypothetical protein KDD55_13440, partial [Bdellovibrionales bacterium]|nr:hypothetical protein [Bdellovibrionales bacterium]